MIIVGEMSGDSHAAKLVKELRKSSDNVEFEFFGATGKKMRDQGVETIVEADNFGIVGVVEVAKALPMFLRVFKKLKKVALERKPDAVVLVDFPDFNLKMATALKKKGLKIIYYVSPQVWVWKKYRVKRIKKYVDLLLTILPFEKDWYAEQDFHKVKYVGNPMAGEVQPKLTRKQFCKAHNLDDSKPIIALLTGSRGNEIREILPILLETACLMSQKNPDLQFVIPLASNRKKSEANAAITKIKEKGFEIPEKLIVTKEETYESVNAANVAAVTSGTATLETAILGTPMVIVYKVSKFTYAVFRLIVSVEHIGLVNLIAQRTLAKELVQNDFTAEKLCEELFCLLEVNENNKMRIELAEIKKRLGDGGTSQVAAEAILNELEL